jgi:pheromone shutdown-related protein TraB
MQAEEATETTRVVDLGTRTVYLLGTAHVSATSVAQVEEQLATLEPNTVCVELDNARYETLTNERGWQELDIRRVLKERKGFLLLANIVLHSFQRRLGLDAGVRPGAEMLAAVQAAERAGLPVVLADRDVQVTLRRAWKLTGLWGRLKMLSALLASAFTREKLEPEQIETMKEQDVLGGMLEELASYLPAVKRALIDERDQYLAAKIFQSDGQKVLAVVGAGHLLGIEQRLQTLYHQPQTDLDADVAALEVIPPKTLFGKLAPWSIPVLFAALVTIGLLRVGFDVTAERLLQWVLVNGTFAALGSLAALAHPLTILIAFAAAPITSVNPTVGVGLFTALIEAIVRKPRVADFATLSDDAGSVRGFYRNRVTHIFLVFLLSSVGSAIGTFVGFSFLTSLLGGGGG